MQQILDAMTGAAAFLRNGRLDVLTANQLGYALYSPVCAGSVPPVNLARFIFLDPRSNEFYADWDGIAPASVGSLRTEAGRDPYDRDLTDLVGEQFTRSEDFRSGGLSTTWSTTAAASSRFTTRLPVISPSITTPWRSPLIQGSPSSPTPLSPARHPSTA